MWLEERFREFNLKRPGPNCSHSRSDECLTRRQKVWQDCPIAQALLALLAACYTKKSESMVTEKAGKVVSVITKQIIIITLTLNNTMIHNQLNREQRW